MLVEWLWILVTSNVNFNSVRRKPRACERRLKNWSSGSLWSQNDGKMMGEWWKPQNFLQKFDGLYSIWVYSQVPKFFLYFGIIVIPDFWGHPKEVKDGEFLHFLESQNQNSDSLPLDIWFFWGYPNVGRFMRESAKCAVGRRVVLDEILEPISDLGDRRFWVGKHPNFEEKFL